MIEVPGFDDENDAYSIKIAGLYGIVVAVDILLKVGNIEREHIDVGCDGLSVLNESKRAQSEDMSSNQVQLDLLSGMYGIKRILDIS